jgi:hypothetical protein
LRLQMEIPATQRAIPRGRTVVSVQEMPHNNRIHSGRKKHRSFLTPLFTAGDAHVRHLKRNDESPNLRMDFPLDLRGIDVSSRNHFHG